MMTLPTQVHTGLTMLEAAGYEAYLVGGAVRDYVMGRPATDWDIATDALPTEVETVFQGFRLMETGLKHGTVTVFIDKVPLEITTFRVDGDYSDHRRPDEVQFTKTLHEDLARRDFTMNALAYHPKTGVIDFYGGVEDIRQGVVRCVGVPEKRFREDGLRILRALRFASVYDLKIDGETAASIHRNRDLLRHIAVERIRVELTKLLCGKGVERILTDHAAVMAVCIPELTPMFGFEQHNPHHDRDVWSHTIAVVANSPEEPVSRWAALLHDIGKPACFQLAGDGVGHFYGHAEKSTELAAAILGRLRFDNAGRDRITGLVRYHDLPIVPEQKRVKRLMNKLGADAVRQLIELHKADTKGQSDLCRYRLAEYEQVSETMNEILNEEACFSLKDLAVNGSDMLALGLRGPAIGRALDQCLNAVIDEKAANERSALMAFVRATQLPQTLLP